MDIGSPPPGFREMLDFPLAKAISGRRARRVATGTTTPDGPLHFVSGKPPAPLSEWEKMSVLAAMSGSTGWHYLIMGNPRYAPHLSSYACAAPGRPFPSAAGFETSEVFFTDDSGVYFLPTRDAAPADETADFTSLVKATANRVRKLSDERLYIPREEPFIEGHNFWIANVPGSMLVIPVGDLAQHVLANLCYYLQNGYVIYDDISDQRIPGIDRCWNLADVKNPLPLSFVEMWCFGEVVTELACACYAGMLMLQAVGLGGWVFDGVNPFAVLGASGDPRMPGLGFRYEQDESWPTPNPVGLDGIFEGFCPPYYSDMREAVEALAARKFGPGGPFSPETPGPWLDSADVRGAAEVYSDDFKECVALMAQYIYDRFGKFPATVPSTLVLPFLQVHHLDLDFYDQHFKPGAYLESHARHAERWHI